MDLRSKIRVHQEKLPIYGLGTFLLIAGASKFLILQYWTGYEPQILLQTLPVTAKQLTLVGGLLETVLGLGLLSGRKTRYFTLLTALWLTAITVQVTRLEFWALAIRDLGLTLYAWTAFSRTYIGRSTAEKERI